MSLEQTAELYASVLRQLLPDGVYDTAEMTHVADDIYAHAKALAQADIDAHRLLRVLETIPVDLLADYEREYGLPMQCMVPGSQTIEERIHVLRWIRQHRNVMNREYLEQILAIFGVTLVDVVKHRPMLCTAPCNSPVNTERLRYKVLLRLQYPMTADMSCIIENYLPGYLRVEWVVDMPWGEWIISPTVTVNTTGIAHYTAYKTNQNDYYDSYANLDLNLALVHSFSDTDMRELQGFIEAIITVASTEYTLDIDNSRIAYYEPLTGLNHLEWLWINSNSKLFATAEESALDYLHYIQSRGWGHVVALGSYTGSTEQRLYSGITNNGSVVADLISVSRAKNKNYDPSILETRQLLYAPFSQIAQAIILNTQSSEPISTVADAYINAVASSIFNADESRQFVKQSDLLSQFEHNKTLRT